MCHYTGLAIDKPKFDSMLKCPTFFSPTPIYYNTDHLYYKGKKCVFYKVKKDISNLLDLTSNGTV